MRTFVFAVLLSVLCGCATTKGPRAILSADGLKDPPPKASDISLARKFVAAAELAAGKLPVVPAGKVAPPPDGRTPQEKSLAMFEAGTTLVYANCSDFFGNAGRTQTRLMVWKDAIGVLGTLAAGVIALNGSGTGDLDRLAVISLGSSTALSGIDIYTQRFLFAAENVDAVRELTLNALVAHSDKVMESPPQTYEAVSRHLLDNQALCFPPRIAMLARDAIKNGTVVAYTNSTGPAPALAATSDQVIYQDIGDRVGLAGPVSEQQAQGYFWLLVKGANAADRKLIQPMLSEIPPENNPFKGDKTDPAALKDTLPHRTFIRERLGRLSPQTIKSLRDEIGKKGASPAPAVPPSPPTGKELENARVKIQVF